MKFTDRTIKNLKPKDKRYELFENNRQGFGIRVSPSGVKSWVYMFRFEERQIRMTLGSYPKMSLAKAHTAHAQAKEKLDHGINPNVDHLEEKDRDRRALTVESLANFYLERWAKRHKRTWKEDRRNLFKDVVPRWGNRKARDIRKADVIELLEDIERRVDTDGKPARTSQVRHVFAVVRKMFNFALERDLLESNPCFGVKSPPPPEPRKRFLNEEEIQQFWNRLDDCRMSDEIRRALKLTLVTGQRPGEVIGIQESEIDGRWWTLPGERSKNKRPHRIFMTEFATSLLGNPQGGPVFPSPKDGSKPIEINAVSKAVRKNLDILGLEDFKPHDLRGTVTTQMSKLGIEKYVRERIQNHIDQSVSAKHYDAHDYDAEKRQGLERWARRLSTIISGQQDDTVVELKR